MVYLPLEHNKTQHDIDGMRSLASIISIAIPVIIFIFLSIFGNILVVMAVLKTNSLREDKSNFLVINLAATDMLNGSTVMLATFVALVMDLHEVPYTLCNLICAANYCFLITSMMTLCFISIDRLLAIVFPLTYSQKVSSKVILAAIIISWLEGIIFSVAPMIQDWIKYDYWEVTCAIQWHKEGKQALYYVIAAFVICFLIPGLVLACNYAKILREAKKKMKVWSVAMTTSKNKSEIRKIKKESASAKAVRSLLIVVCAYFVCMTPFSVTKLIKVSVVQPIIPGFVNTIASILAFASSVVNPLIYGIFRRDFRKAFKNMLRKSQLSSFTSTKVNPTCTITHDEVTLTDK